jgi:3-hydroxyisobutyrate dehydrogenase
VIGRFSAIHNPVVRCAEYQFDGGDHQAGGAATPAPRPATMGDPTIMKTVAFLGLGKMGSAMAARLLAAGHGLHLYNRSVERAQVPALKGAHVFATPAQACVGADLIISMVADDRASQCIWGGPDGVLAADCHPGTLAIECSTLSHEWVLELAAHAAARGLRYIDSPVTGLPEAAAAGALTLLLGASDTDLLDARSTLECFANRIFHFGAVGTGTAYKLIINLLGAVQIASAAESVAMAERAGLDLQTVIDAIAAGQAASPQVVRNVKRMAAGDYEQDVVFTPQLRLKDVRYALKLAQSLSIGSPFGALAGSTFQQLCDGGLAQVNESAVLEVARARLPDP